MGTASKKDYRVIATVNIKPFVSQERVLAVGKDDTIGHVYDWLEQIGQPIRSICIAKAVSGFDTPGLVPED